MSDKISFCGLNCLKCNAYNPDKKKDFKKEIKVQDGAKKITCHGCKDSEVDLSNHIASCKIRFCAKGKGLLNCAYCVLYPCKKTDLIISKKKSSKAFL